MIRSKSFLLGLGLLLTAACSKENNIDQSQTTSNFFQQTLGPGGGVVGDQNGLSVYVPANALAQDELITLQTADGGYPAPTMTTVGPIYSFEPHGLLFAAPATVHLPVPAGALATAAFHAEPGGQWTQVGGFEVNSGLASFPTNTFSFFVLGQGGETPFADAGDPGGKDGGTMTTGPDGGSGDGGSGGNTGTDCGTGPTPGAPTGTTTGTGTVGHDLAPPNGLQFNALDGYAVSSTSQVTGPISTTYQAHLTLVFTDYMKACGYAQGMGMWFMDGMERVMGGKQGSRVLTVHLDLQGTSPVQIQPMTYGQGNPDGMAHTEFTGMDAACQQERFGVGMTTLTIDSITATEVMGHVDATNPSNGDTFSGDFSFPICDLPQNQQAGGGMCCLP